MKCCSDTKTCNGFSLIEVVTALAILGLISGSVLLVISRGMKAAADSNLRMKAFEVARENMESLLATHSVSEQAEYGISEKYRDIKWQTTVEAFYEPITKRMWLRGVCTAGYTDSADKEQQVELAHWLTDLTREQIMQILQRRAAEIPDMLFFESLEEAAEYADVSIETIKMWIENGLVLTGAGSVSSGMVDLFAANDGVPPPEAIQQQEQVDSDSQTPPSGEKPDDKTKPEGESENKGRTYILCGQVYTDDDFRQMTLSQMLDLLTRCL